MGRDRSCRKGCGRGHGSRRRRGRSSVHHIRHHIGYSCGHSSGVSPAAELACELEGGRKPDVRASIGYRVVVERCAALRAQVVAPLQTRHAAMAAYRVATVETHLARLGLADDAKPWLLRRPLTRRCARTRGWLGGCS